MVDERLLNERLSRMAQAVARLERKTDFMLQHLNLTYVEIPPARFRPNWQRCMRYCNKAKNWKRFKRTAN